MLDLRRPESIEAVHRIIPHVDIVVENVTPGVMERRGARLRRVSAINPRSIMASVRAIRTETK